MNNAPGQTLYPLPCPVDVEDLVAEVAVVSIPLTVKFRGIRQREAVVLRGPHGWAEFAPFVEYDDLESVPWWRSCVEAAWLGFPRPLRSHVPVNATIPAVEPGRVPEILDSYGDGINTVKVKVAEKGQCLQDDLARVAAVRAYAPHAAIRVDANQGWSVQQAVDALSRLAEYELEYAEQPAAGIDGLYAVKETLAGRGIEVLIAADESVRKADDPLAVARSGAADVVVVKVAPLGGVRRALSIVRDAGLPAVVSSAIDTSVGLSAGLALAASLPQLPYACGLGTGSLLRADVTDNPVRARDGQIAVQRVQAVPSLLESAKVSQSRRQWWMQRIRRVHALSFAEDLTK